MRSPILALTLLAGGCYEDTIKHTPQGDLFVTPKHGITYYGIAQDAPGIDAAADMWLDWCKLRSVDPWATLQSCAINVFEGETVNGVSAGWWHGDGWIDVARNAPYGSDKYFGLDSIGLLWLRHEWLHELYQDGSHSKFPYPD